jgi:hypothetical protein
MEATVPGAGGPNAGPPATVPAAPSAPVFGRLEPVRIRDFWKDEARDFTPWLAEADNVVVLGDTIGLNLELIGVEQAVGPLEADIVAEDEGHLVVIETQLEATDHKHLGQLSVAGVNEGSATIWLLDVVRERYGGHLTPDNLIAYGRRRQRLTVPRRRRSLCRAENAEARVMCRVVRISPFTDLKAVARALPDAMRFNLGEAPLPAGDQP